MTEFYTKPKHLRLWEACSYGQVSKVEKLINEGANVNWKSPVGKSFILDLIIRAGAKIDSVDNEGNTALHHSVMTGNMNNVIMILKADADVNAENKNKWTPLFNSLYWNHPDVTRVLLQYGANPWLKNKDGRTPLHELCRSKSKSCDKLLENFNLLIEAIDHVKSMDDSNKNNCMSKSDFINMRAHSSSEWGYEADFTPFLFACYHGQLELVNALIDHGVDLYVTDKNQWTALHWAAQRCHADIVEVLLHQGFSRGASDLRGNMPYSVTSDVCLQECLLPDNLYPSIVSNGHVTTDEESDGELKIRD